MTRVIGTRVPSEVARAIEYVAKEEHTDKSKVVRELMSGAVKLRLIDLALEKYTQRTVSLGRAAELARLPLADFMKLAAEKHIPLYYTLASLHKDFAALKERT